MTHVLFHDNMSLVIFCETLLAVMLHLCTLYDEDWKGLGDLESKSVDRVERIEVSAPSTHLLSDPVHSLDDAVMTYITRSTYIISHVWFRRSCS